MSAWNRFAARVAAGGPPVNPTPTETIAPPTPGGDPNSVTDENEGNGGKSAVEYFTASTVVAIPPKIADTMSDGGGGAVVSVQSSTE